MSDVNKIISSVTDWQSMGIKTIASTTDKVFNLKRNPNIESGLDIGWTNIKLRLKTGLYVVTGIPGSGKSIWIDNVIIKSILNHRWKWLVFSPENNPRENHIKDFIEILTDKELRNLTDKETQEAMDVLNEFIAFIEPPSNEALKIENIMKLIKMYHADNSLNGFLLDPYNEFSYTRPQGMSETEYVSLFLSEIRKTTTNQNLSSWIVAHPTKLRKGEDGKYPVPSAYDIAGSANFYNKPDQIICVHREKNRELNPENISEIYIQKVKRKTNGELGVYPLKFNYKTNRFTEVPRYTDEDVPNYDNQYSSK